MPASQPVVTLARQFAVGDLFAVDLEIFGAVVIRRALEGVALDAEHRALDRLVVAEDLRI
jgi:hypothetical protein